jgi:hypothetical protein
MVGINVLALSRACRSRSKPTWRFVMGSMDPVQEVVLESVAPPAAAPVSETQRVKLIDALRGVALLGILLMNIPGFAMPDYFSESFQSDPSNVNFWVSAVITIGFEGKMRALFGMIFGAGVLLFVMNKGISLPSTQGKCLGLGQCGLAWGGY